MRGPENESPHRCRDHGRQHHQRHAVGGQEQRRIQHRPQELEGEIRKHAGHQELRVHQQQDHESPEDEEVVESEFLVDHTPLAKGIDQHAAEPGPQVIEAVLPTAQTHQGQ